MAEAVPLRGVRARGLCREYVSRSSLLADRRRVSALERIDLEIPDGPTLAIVGASGSGKSTLARCLAGLEQPSGGGVELDGRDPFALGASARAAHRRSVQLVFQEGAASLNPRLSAAEIVSEPLLIAGTGVQERRSEARAHMERVGLAAEWADRRPAQLSGGQRQRLALARALAARPRFLLLDEALAGLDPALQALVVNLLLDLREARGLTLVFISHDLGLVSQFADRVAVLREGRIVEQGEAAAVLARPQHEYTRALVAAC